MNPYQNKNEYEILKSSSDYTKVSNKYPFANDPNIAMKHTNYKDWMHMCETPTPSFVSIIINVVNLFARVLSLSKTFTNTSKYIGIIGGILGLLGSNFNSESTNMWDDLIKHIEELTDKLIDTNVRFIGMSTVNGLNSQYLRYLDLFESWYKDQNNENKRNNLVSAFQILDSAFINALGYRNTTGQETRGTLSTAYEVQFLPSYAQAANLHLLLLRDAVTYGNVWRLIKPTSDYYNRFKDNIARYTDYCTEYFHRGLDNLKKPGSDAVSWLRFNGFRRDMTLMVLDLITLFPLYDSVQYPLPTKIELSRKIYTDPVGSTISDFGNWTLTNRTLANFNDLEREVTDGPSLLKWLNALVIYTGAIDNRRPLYPGDRIGVWYGHRAEFIIPDSNEVSYRFTGEMAYEDSNTIIASILDNDIYKVNLRAAYVSITFGSNDSTFGVSSSQFFNIRGIHQLYQSSQPIPSWPITIAFPGEESSEGNANDYSHRLCDVKNITGGLRQTPARGRSSLLSHAWTHSSLKPRNIIAIDEITQIPAVKAFNISDTGAGSVVAGPGHTGGDLIRLPNNNARLKIRLTPSTSDKRFRVRVRYASTTAGRMRITKYWSPGYVQHYDFNFDAQYYDSNLTFRSFHYLDTMVTRLDDPGVEIIVQNIGGSILYIDKIEIIPIDAVAFEDEVEQSLKKAVSDLFIN
ncbi:insecticidal delta-endotoxin Cry8Ea1 family protein [Bacillus thuringiensis]|uniref:Crystaline entomocidal protoxin n=1 Tax=Bacillus thuringiensis TaxID=1428 RepID=A0A184Y2E6_BACTU|nr:insecticidal delta-endotoxin Cry8Ea1 family protein [Bacillus thuringiensis]AHL90402.1 pesticidal crystal protein Cry24 [Bacillus thuringiensis]MDY7962769.1 insecticidal delta-endotoxin Cry8Ea1 family protein [Bacillus thuringiensis]